MHFEDILAVEGHIMVFLFYQNQGVVIFEPHCK